MLHTLLRPHAAAPAGRPYLAGRHAQISKCTQLGAETKAFRKSAAVMEPAIGPSPRFFMSAIGDFNPPSYPAQSGMRHTGSPVVAAAEAMSAASRSSSVYKGARSG